MFAVVTVLDSAEHSTQVCWIVWFLSLFLLCCVVTGQQVNIKKTASLELVHLKIPNILSLIGYIINSWFVTHTVQPKVEFVGHYTTKYID